MTKGRSRHTPSTLFMLAAVLGALAAVSSASAQAPAAAPNAQPIHRPANPAAAQAPGASSAAPSTELPAAAPLAAPSGAAPTAGQAPGAPRRRVGYLGADGVPDDARFLPPPPAVESPHGIADRAVFHATRALEGGPRWQLATRDNEIGQKALFADFACALGTDLSAANAPAISRVLGRSMGDLFIVVGAAKDRYQRPRPFVTEEGPVCIVPSEEFARSGSYPSGHSASGWLYALVLAEIDPDNSAAIMARGRAYGESRVVCGVHYDSDIEGGRITAATVVAALHGSAEFEVDMVAARTELAELKIAPAKPDPAACSAEGPQLAKPY